MLRWNGVWSLGLTEFWIHVMCIHNWSSARKYDKHIRSSSTKEYEESTKKIKTTMKKPNNYINTNQSNGRSSKRLKGIQYMSSCIGCADIPTLLPPIFTPGLKLIDINLSRHKKPSDSQVLNNFNFIILYLRGVLEFSHCGLETPYGDIDLRLPWLRLWLGVIRRQAIT